MNLTFKIISGIDEAKTIWDQFSPNQTLDDDWNFRYIFTKNLDLKLHFFVGFEEDNPVGILTLQENPNIGISKKVLGTEKPFLEFFGGVDTDNNQVLLKSGYENLQVEFLNQIKTYAVLSDLDQPLEFNGLQAEHYNDKFILNLRGFENFEDFLLKNFDGKSRQRLKNRLNKLYKEYEVKIEPGTKEDLDKMYQFSIQRFGEGSSFNLPERQQLYRDLYDNFETDFFVIKLNREIKAASFAIKFKDTYTSINNGYDLEIRDLAKILAATQIKRAMEMGFKVYDGGKGDNGWKEHFHLTKVPLYKLTLND